MGRLWISVDVEPDISEFLRDSYSGICEGLPRLLDLLDEFGIRADFFVVGQLVASFPELVRDITRRGHEVGSHGFDHRLLCAERPSVQYSLIERSLEALKKASGQPIRIFRAPNFSANWATIEALERLGVDLDSSVLPGRIARKWRVFKVYDHRDAPRRPYRPSRTDIDEVGSSKVLEVPLTENPAQEGTPVGLGFLNIHSSETASHLVECVEAPYVSFLIHPWELVDLPVRDRGLPTWLASA